MKKPYIVYSLSKDRTTQKFKRNKFHEILQDIDAFFQHCTTGNFSVPDEIRLTAYTAYDDTDPTEVLNELLEKTKDRFGASNPAPVAFHFPSGEPHSTYKHEWRFPSERLQEAVQYIIDNSPMPISNFGPLELFISYHFNLVDPLTKLELPDQLYKGSLLIWFSRGKSCSPTIFFPFERVDDQFWNYVDSIIPYLPFELEEKYLRIAHVNKQGEVSSFKKVHRLA